VPKPQTVHPLALKSLYTAAERYGNVPNGLSVEEGEPTSAASPNPWPRTRYDLHVTGSDVRILCEGQPISEVFSTVNKELPHAPSQLHEFLEDVGLSRADAHMICTYIEQGSSVHGVFALREACDSGRLITASSAPILAFSIASRNRCTCSTSDKSPNRSSTAFREYHRQLGSFRVGKRDWAGALRATEPRSRPIGGQSGVDPNALPEYSVPTDPSVYETPIVSDLKTSTVDRLDDVQVLAPAHFAKHNISHRKSGTINGRNRAKLARFDPSLHGVASWTKGDGLSGSKFLDIVRRPTQTSLHRRF
jgi:hypothetical protein